MNTDQIDTPGTTAFRAGFAAFQDQIYLNLAARGLISRTTRATIEEALDDQMYGRIDKQTWKTAAASARTRFATLCHAAPDEVAITKNVTEGLNTLALALPWVHGDNMLFCPDFEHPNGVYCFANLQNHCVTPREIAARAGTIDIDALIAAMDDRTRLVAVSAVGFATGLRADLARLGRACAERGIFFLVDAAQAIGVIDIDVDALHIDGLAASTNKGLLGLYGQGFLYCRRRWADRLIPFQLSRFGINAGDRPESEMGAVDSPLRSGAGRFELGNPNWPALIASNASMGELLDLGPAQVQTQAFGVATRLITGFRDLGLPVVKATTPAQQSHIVVVAPQDDEQRARLNTLGDGLDRAGIRHSVRRGALRFACHAYNTQADAERVLELTAEILDPPTHTAPTNLKGQPMSSIDTPQPNQPGGRYVPARICETTQLHMAGQTARRGETMIATGRVGGEVDLASARACAVQCIDNLLAHAEHAVGLQRITGVARLNVYVAATADFRDHSRVADAASDRLAEKLAIDSTHVRSAIGVASLPRLSPVEIDAIFELGGDRD